MAKQWQIRRGTTVDNEEFTGAEGELTYDITLKQLRIHDGNTVGGTVIGKNIPWNDVTDKPSTFTPSTHNHVVSEITDFPELATVATSGSYNDLTDKPTIPTGQVQTDWNATSGIASILNKPTLSTVATSGSYNDLSNKPSIPSTANDVSALPDTTKYGASLSLSIDDTAYVITATLKDQNGNTLGTAQTIDLPLESVVVSGRYDSANKKVILTLKDGSEIDFSVADLVSGLQTEITSTSKLDADLIDDSTSSNKFVSSSDKTNWNSKVDASSLATVATSGSYNDLTDKPAIPTGQVNSDWNASSGVAQILNKPELATVATSGNYNDLSNKPAIPTVPTDVSAFNNDAGYLTEVNWNDISNKPTSFTPSAHSHVVSDISNFPTLSTVATTGDYDDLSNKPTIPAAQVNSDWNATSGISQILNKPTLGTMASESSSDYTKTSDLATIATSGDYDDLSNKPIIPAAQVQSDWNATTGMGVILNKPTIPTKTSDLTNDSGYLTSVAWNNIDNKPSSFTPSSHTHTVLEITDFPELALVATSGSYNDLADKPIIPTAQVNSDWNANSGVAQILNKPELATIATSGDYNDLSNKPTIPTIPTDISAFNNDVGYLTTVTWNNIDNKPTSFTPSSHTHATSDITDFPTLATVATSGDYDDLSNKPTIPTKTSDLTNDSGYLTSVAWNDIDNKPSTFTPSSHTHSTSDITDFPTLSSVAISGDYNDLTNKPTIPAAQVQTDWNATTGMGVILNKPSTFAPSAHNHTVSEITDFPTLSTVATSGDYEDLSNTPTNFTGTDGTDAGTQGLVPAPAVTDVNKYLKADGTWAIVESTVTSSIDCGVL